MSASSEKFPRYTERTKRPIQGSDSAASVTRAGRMPFRGNFDGFRKGMPRFAHWRSMSRHMYAPFAG